MLHRPPPASSSQLAFDRGFSGCIPAIAGLAACLLGGVLSAGGSAVANELPYPASLHGLADPLDRPAPAAPVADRVVLTAIARAGSRLVAVGERGIILLSDDNAGSWRQASTPVSVSLTGVHFVDARQGWAIGHGGVVLHSVDAGTTWQRQLDGREVIQRVVKAAEQEATDPQGGDRAKNDLQTAQRMAADGPDKPWLALDFRDAADGWIVGAYGLIFHTRDGGKTWQQALDRVDNPKGLHLYAIREMGQDIYLAGEQGFLARSTDGGQHFTRLATPYSGTYFALQISENGRLIVAGLRGHVYFSDDHGEHWQPAQVPAPISFSAMTQLEDGRLLVVDQTGGLFQSLDHGDHLERLATPPGPPLTDVTMAADGTLVATRFGGALRLEAATTVLAGAAAP